VEQFELVAELEGVGVVWTIKHFCPNLYFFFFLYMCAQNVIFIMCLNYNAGFGRLCSSFSLS